MLSLEHENGRQGYTEYYIPKVKIKENSVKIDRIFFDQIIDYDIKTYENRNWYCLRRWLHNWLFIRLSFFQRKLENDSNRFK